MNRLKMTEEKIRKMVLPSDPFYKSLKESTDWVEELKVCLSFLSDSLRKFASDSAAQGLVSDLTKNTKGDGL
jgi:hypothetical protein